ncbi:MAG: hypothetical protein KIT68_04865 [Phycisphaeraceae bacterium]|nr:hypothetical protein [Phycisphaeraceae bacterium]
MIACDRKGHVEFRVFLPHAADVRVIGDFTAWRTGALPMRRSYPGWWSVDADVPAGQHEFCYLVDGHLWIADYAAHGVHADRAGHWLSRLRIAPEHAPA